MIGYAPLLGQIPLALAQETGFHRLGQAAPVDDWRARIEAAIAKMRAAPSRIYMIASKTEREAISNWFGSPDMPGTPQFVAETASNDLAFGRLDEAKSKLPQLEAFVKELDVKLKNAETAVETTPGIPSWAWIAGGLAAAGLVGWWISRNR